MAGYFLDSQEQGRVDKSWSKTCLEFSFHPEWEFSSLFIGGFVKLSQHRLAHEKSPIFLLITQTQIVFQDPNPTLHYLSSLTYSSPCCWDHGRCWGGDEKQRSDVFQILAAFCVRPGHLKQLGARDGYQVTQDGLVSVIKENFRIPPQALCAFNK